MDKQEPHNSENWIIVKLSDLTRFAVFYIVRKSDQISKKLVVAREIEQFSTDHAKVGPIRIESMKQSK